MLDIEDKNIVGVRPPLYEAEKITKTKNIAILGTESAVQSKELSKFGFLEIINQTKEINTFYDNYKSTHDTLVFIV